MVRFTTLETALRLVVKERYRLPYSAAWSVVFLAFSMPPV
jgi:hypothetical protein